MKQIVGYREKVKAMFTKTPLVKLSCAQVVDNMIQQEQLNKNNYKQISSCCSTVLNRLKKEGFIEVCGHTKRGGMIYCYSVDNFLNGLVNSIGL
jgi:predicted transcriptional regulator